MPAGFHGYAAETSDDDLFDPAIMRWCQQNQKRSMRELRTARQPGPDSMKTYNVDDLEQLLQDYMDINEMQKFERRLQKLRLEISSLLRFRDDNR